MLDNIEIAYNDSKMSEVIAHKIRKIFDISSEIKKLSNTFYLYNNSSKQNKIFFLIFPICGDNRIPVNVENWIAKNIIKNSKCIVIILCDKDDSFMPHHYIRQEIMLLVKKKLGDCPIDPLLIDVKLEQNELLKKDWVNMVYIYLKTSIRYPSALSSAVKPKKNIQLKVAKVAGIRLKYIKEKIDNSTKLTFVDRKNTYERSTINGFKKKEFEAFKNLILSYKNLKYLSIPNAGLNDWFDLPNNFCEQIEVLDIHGNNFTDYSFLVKFKNLTKLNLAANNLGNIPKEIFELKNLAVLLCYKNFISNIDCRIGELKQLKRFSVYRNQLSDIPQALSQCNNLISLNLGANKFELIPTNIFLLKNLQILSFRNCDLKLIDKKIYQLKHLNTLDVTKNNNLQLII